MSHSNGLVPDSFRVDLHVAQTVSFKRLCFVYDAIITDVNGHLTGSTRPRAHKPHVDFSVAFLLTKVQLLRNNMDAD